MQVCERLIGPPAVLAAICKLHPKAPFQWRRQSSSRAAGDLPHARQMRDLLVWARDNAVPLAAEDLIFGALEDEIEARLARMRSPGGGPRERAA